MINLGTDIVSDWSFTDGDLNIVSGTGNLAQAIQNRLNTYLDDLNMFYSNYGSTLFDLLGDLNHETIHEYIKIEIEHEIIKDNRIRNVNCTVTKIGNGKVECNLNLILVDRTDIDLNLIITADNIAIIGTNGVEI